MMKTLYSMYVSKGQPVMIDEFGARNKGNTKSRAAYARYFVAARQEPMAFHVSGGTIITLKLGNRRGILEL